MQPSPPDFEPSPERRVFCNRTLNMRSIQAVGFDMDYTLVHYDVPVWEARAYAHVQRSLLERGYPVGALRFDADMFARGLVIDLDLGNIVKANRFGWVTKAAHGTQTLPHELQRAAYGQVWVDLSEPRWVFLNTLFSLSEACIYAQLVDLLDAGTLPGDTGYGALYEIVRDAMNAAHLEGELKAEVIASPERFVVLDPELPRALLDLRQAGKRLFLATNSEPGYTRAMLAYTLDRFLEGGTWHDLFDAVIVQARKPAFFEGAAALEEVADDGTVRPAPGGLARGRIYRGGNAQLVQRHLGCDGDEILYVGDHVYADVHVSSRIRRWRTALVLRELEQEIAHEHAFAAEQEALAEAMRAKERAEREQALLRLALQRIENGAPLPAGMTGPVPALQERLRALRAEGEALDQVLGPLVKRAGEIGHPRWGPLMRAGNDKSRLARQIERHADVYTSRVANLAWLTPFGYLRAARGVLPHDSVLS